MVRRVVMPSGYKDEAARRQRMESSWVTATASSGDGDPSPLPLPEAGFEAASFLRFRRSPEG